MPVFQIHIYLFLKMVNAVSRLQKYSGSYDELMTKAGYLEDYKAEIKQPELEIPTYDERISGLSKENQNVIEKMLSWLESQERVKKE
jgi:uncharacterized coiled-coil DUF342 family protein